VTIEQKKEKFRKTGVHGTHGRIASSVSLDSSLPLCCFLLLFDYYIVIVILSVLQMYSTVEIFKVERHEGNHTPVAL